MRSYLPTAASLIDCRTTKHNLAGFALRLSAGAEDGLLLKCWIIWLAHVCMSDTRDIISTNTEIHCLKMTDNQLYT